MAYTDLVERFVLPNEETIRSIRSTHAFAITVRGCWYEILDVLGYQHLVPASNYQILDVKNPDHVPGEVGGIPGWVELRALLSHPYGDDAGHTQHLLWQIWKNDSGTTTQQLARLSYCLRTLTTIPTYRLAFHTPIYGFLRTAIAHPVDWDYLTDLDVAAWKPFRAKLTTHMRSPVFLALHVMRPQLGQLDATLNRLVADNEPDQAYSLTLRGLTALFFLHHCATMERYRAGFCSEEQTALTTITRDLWSLTMGLMQP